MLRRGWSKRKRYIDRVAAVLVMGCLSLYRVLAAVVLTFVYTPCI